MEEEAIVVGVRVPGGDRAEILLATLHPPRTTLLLPARGPEPLPGALREIARPDATIVVDGARPKEVLEGIAAALPDAEVLRTSAREVLRFLWFYRDRHDPMALGHSSERTLLDGTYLETQPPDYRRKGGKRAMQGIRSLLATTGWALGVRPPLPPPPSAPDGFGRRRAADAVEACAALYAGCLRRWGSPLARVERGEIALADRWLRARRG